MFSIFQLFVGLGFPYEGPAPLEAIANGCAFLNLRFNPPKSSKNTEFFKGKPTLREVSFVNLDDFYIDNDCGFLFSNTMQENLIFTVYGKRCATVVFFSHQWDYQSLFL